MKHLDLKSILFVPAHKLNLAEKATKSEATAICLDLEDGVPPHSKEEARLSLKLGIDQINKADKYSFVRINSELELISLDLAHVPPQCHGLVLPKAGSLQHINMLANALDRLFGSAGPRIICLVESGADLDQLRMSDGVPNNRILGLCLGTEDLAADYCTTSSSKLIKHSFMELAILCRRWNLSLLGFPGSIAEYKDLDRLENWARESAESGSLGAFCIHPKQIDILNKQYVPSALDQEKALIIIKAFEEALSKGEGVCSVDGKMIDRPVYLNALNTISRV